jgi:thiol-disulfide isomerase/thioredoxin
MVVPSPPRVRAPAIDPALEWVGVDGPPPTLAALRGRVVVLDFWTAGCINCRHLVPTLDVLAATFGDAIALLGVHSGKYPAERTAAAIAAACARLGVHHPVVNDRAFRTWRAYAVRAWPTLVVIDREGYVVATRSGETLPDAIAPVIARALATPARTDRGDDAPLVVVPPLVVPPPALHAAASPTALRFPAAVAVAPHDARVIAIADAGHGRVLVGTLDIDAATCTITHVSGDGTRARRDGAAPRWADPQGLVFAADGTLVVADTGAHTLRTLDPRTGVARTVAGTGARVRDEGDRAAGALASPWGLARLGDRIVVAMAGTHTLAQLDVASGRVTPFAGSGAEALWDGDATTACFAQPTAVATDGATVWTACAEGNAIRATDAVTGTTTTLVGTGLFDVGHVDGVGDAARLQHPQGLAWDATGARLMVADTYNGALRTLDPATRRLATLVTGLDAPTGIAALADGTLLVCEEGAHRLLLVSPTGGVRPVILAVS